MGRTKARTYFQPDENTCGPASLKTALEILGVRKSFKSLVELCGTNRNGTPVHRLIKAANQLGLSALCVEWATLRHIQSTLRYSPGPRAAIVDYLYDHNGNCYEEESGHYAAIASYSSRSSRIVLFDSSTGGKKSYLWQEFMDRWYDYDFKRTKTSLPARKFRLSKKWNNRLLLVLARDPDHLPKFKTSTARFYLPRSN